MFMNVVVAKRLVVLGCKFAIWVTMVQGNCLKMTNGKFPRPGDDLAHLGTTRPQDLCPRFTRPSPGDDLGLSGTTRPLKENLPG